MIIRLILHSIPLLVFGTFAYLLHQEVVLGKESVSWPTTKARLIEASYGDKRNRIAYAYSVEGIQYGGRKLEFCEVSNKNLKKYFLDNIEGKKEITISYRPSEPAKSVVRPGMDDRQFSFYFGLSGFAIFAAIVVERLYRKDFRNRSSRR